MGGRWVLSGACERCSPFVCQVNVGSSMSTDPESRGGFGPYLEGVGPTYLDNGTLRTIRFGEIGDLERALELYGKNVAAFLVEPIQGEAG
jgi:ornithine--oxo-acid transaminase